MPENIVKIDLGAIDKEIEELSKRIELLQSTKKFAQHIAIKDEENDTQVSSIQKLGVSDFISEFLKKSGRSDTKVIIQGYADHWQKSYDEVAGNVSNALSRLKKDKVVDREEKPGGRRAGSVWFINNKTK